jgi:Tfp pilus assembly protein PilF
VPYLNTARAYVRKNDLERAREYVVLATSRFPNDARGWVMLGNIEGMRGDLDAADRAFEKALSIRPDDAEARTGKATVDRARAKP